MHSLIFIFNVWDLPPVMLMLSLFEGKPSLLILSTPALQPLETPACLTAPDGLEWLGLVEPCRTDCPPSVCNHWPEMSRLFQCYNQKSSCGQHTPIRQQCPNLKLLGFVQPLSGLSDGVFQQQAVWEVRGDARCLLSNSSESLYGVWRSGGHRKQTLNCR